MSTRSCFYVLFLLVGFISTMSMSMSMTMANIAPPRPPQCRSVVASTTERLQFLFNLIILKTELFLRLSIGVGIDDISPGLVRGPVPRGATIANLDSATRDIIEELGYQGVGHLRAIVKNTILNAPIPRPEIDISTELYANIVNQALNVTLDPPINIYDGAPVVLVAAAFSSSILQQYYAEIIPFIAGSIPQKVLAGIALTEAAGFGVLRSQLNAIVNVTVTPYTFTAGDLLNGVAQLFNQAAGCGLKDEGLVVPLQLGAENRTTSNVVPADVNSLAFARTEREILRFLFGTGNATMPGGFFPSGVNGTLYRRIVLGRLA